MITVLYVDDEAGLSEITQLFLEKDGEFKVGTALSAQEALDSHLIPSYDAIVSDYQMPGMDGIAFLKNVRERFGDIPFILFTGKGREEVVIDAINNGADFYIQKGGDPRSQFAELAHKIRQAVRRKKAERSLYDSKRRLADIINFLPDATFAIDFNGRVIAWNRAMEKMTGVKSSEILGKDNYEYAIPFYQKRRPILIDLILKNDPVTAGKYPAITQDGTTLYSEITIPHFNNEKGAALWFTASPLYDSRGTIVGAIESIREITERKRAEDALRKSQQQLKDAMDLAGLVNWEYDFKAGMFEFDDRFFAMVGTSADREGGNRIPVETYARTFVHPDDMHAVEDEMEKAVRSTDLDYVSRREHRIIRRDGTILHVLILIRVMRDASMLPIKVHGTIQDLTEEKRTEDALRESESRYRELAEILPHMIFELDKEFMVTYANRQTLTTLGLTDQDINDGIHGLSIIDPSQHNRFKEDVQKSMSGTRYEPREYTAVRKDGSRFPVIIYSATVYRNSEVVGFRGVMDGISSRVKTGEEGFGGGGNAARKAKPFPDSP